MFEIAAIGIIALLVQRIDHNNRIKEMVKDHGKTYT